MQLKPPLRRLHEKVRSSELSCHDLQSQIVVYYVLNRIRKLLEFLLLVKLSKLYRDCINMDLGFQLRETAANREALDTGVE